MDFFYLDLVYISKFHGLIGLIEFHDRIEIFEWLIGRRANDPRPKIEGTPENDFENAKTENEKANESKVTKPSIEDDESIIHFTFQGSGCKWVFTISDPDHCPSIPHGHLNKKTNPHPKLNPYKGIAYDSKGNEVNTHRLTKKQLVTLWNNGHFREQARAQIQWYIDTYGFGHFPPNVQVNPTKLPRKRRV